MSSGLLRNWVSNLHMGGLGWGDGVKGCRGDWNWSVQHSCLEGRRQPRSSSDQLTNQQRGCRRPSRQESPSEQGAKTWLAAVSPQIGASGLFRPRAPAAPARRWCDGLLTDWVNISGKNGRILQACCRIADKVKHRRRRESRNGGRVFPRAPVGIA